MTTPAGGDGGRPVHGSERLRLTAIGLWVILAPLALVGAGGVLARQAAQGVMLATEAARSEAELTGVATYLMGPKPDAHLAAVATVAPPSATAGNTLSANTATAAPTATATSTSSTTGTMTALPPSASATWTAAVTPAGPGEVVIGYSVAGRPLTVTQFGTGPTVRLIVAGIHGGNEWNTIALADELIAHVRENSTLVPGDMTLFILRSLNPDGEARGTGIYARANDNGVDLNRNWPSRWRADWSRHGCWKYLSLSGGTHAGSEPETIALMQFMLDYQVDAVISYHSAALGIFAGGQPPDEASVLLAEAVAEVSDYPHPPLDFGCVYTGQLIDWASEHGIAALDVELTNHRDTDLEQNLRILEVFLTWRR